MYVINIQNKDKIIVSTLNYKLLGLINERKLNMKKGMKQIKKLSLLMLVVIFLITATGCGKKTNNEPNKETPTKVNTNKDVIKDQEVESFKLTNTSLVYQNGTSTLVTTVKNTSKQTQYIKSFNIIVKDKSGAVMVTMLGYIGDQIPAGEVRDITSNVDLDLSSASSVQYTINK